MGNCAENTAQKMSVTRQDQDAYALRSYRLSAEAYRNNIMQKEIVEVRIPQKKGKKRQNIVINNKHSKIRKFL